MPQCLNLNLSISLCVPLTYPLTAVDAPQRQATERVRNSAGVCRLKVEDGWVSETAGRKLETPCVVNISPEGPEGPEGGGGSPLLRAQQRALLAQREWDRRVCRQQQ